MKNMRNYISIFILSLMAMMVVSCQDDDFYVAEGEPMEVSISATPQIPGMESRAVLGNEVNITKYTFLYFAGNTSTSKLAYIKEILPNELPFYTMLPSPGTNNTYAAMLLANVSSADLGNPTVGTFTMGDLVNKTKTVSSADNKPTDATKFTWSGYLGVTTASNSLNFVVNPNLARLDVTFTNNVSSAVEITKLRMRSVPNKVGLAQNALNDAGITTAISGVSYIDYNLENVSIKGTAKTEAWYMPQNMKGNNTGGRQNGTPPANATYLEFDVYSTQNANKGVPITTAYKMYPGIRESGVEYYGGMTNFDVKSGIIYDMDITITTDGVNGSIGNGFAAKDPQAVARIKLPTGTNCYMIHPLCDRITSGNGTYYELPIDRVNEYWGANTISDGTKWVVDVIWQDINTRAITFCDEYGNGSNINTYSGSGKKPFYFKLVDKDATAQYQTYGNIVVGLKKEGSSTCLWSWHLWITDYNPDGAPEYSYAKNTINTIYANLMYSENLTHNSVEYIIDKQGGWWYNDSGTQYYGGMWGNVQHYHSLNTTYWVNPCKALWDSGIYANKWMMDRNLGAQGPNNMDMVDPFKAWGLYYQYGRKDPFSYNYTYNIEGTKRAAYPNRGAQWEIVKSQGNINSGIQYPNRFYAPGQVKWATDASSNSWYSPSAPASDGAKTIFDPCPKGWRLPKLDAFYFGRLSTSTNLLPEEGSTSDVVYKENRTIFSVVVDANSSYSAMRDQYRNMAVLQSSGQTRNINSSGALYTWYRDLGTAIPIQGYIDATSGEMVGITSTIESIRACLWGVDLPNANNAPIIQIQPGSWAHASTRNSRYAIYYAGTMTIGSYDGKNWPTPRGQNVRCIQE